jgi:hypothetical protein
VVASGDRGGEALTESDAVKALLIVTSAAETATGLALAGVPQLVASLLLGASLDTPAALIVARMTGAALGSWALVTRVTWRGCRAKLFF